MAGNTPTWEPKETKTTSLLMKIVIWGALIGLGTWGIHTYVPDMITAISLVRQLIGEGIQTIFVGLGFAGLLFLIYSCFFKGGIFNAALSQAWRNLARSTTMLVITSDPLAPLTDQLDEMHAQAEEFDDALNKFDGAIENVNQAKDESLKNAKTAEGRAKAAYVEYQNTHDTAYQAQFKDFSDECNSYTQAANDYDVMVKTKLNPARVSLMKLREANASIIHKLEVQVDILTKKFAVGKAVDLTNAATRKIMRGTDRKQMADMAQQVIQTQFADSLGSLKSLTDLNKKLIDSIDLDKGSFSMELLDKWNAEANAAPVVVTQQLTDQTGIGTVPASNVVTGSFASALLKK